ncbi:MAG: hypothetical protein IJR49_04545, partial [Treponema sp.]|nr:hypothetical protein [Treponema sp.]
SVRISSGIAFSEKKSKVENYVGRDWLIFSIKCTQEKTEESLSLLKDAISKMEFLDKERIKTLLEETLNEMRSSIIPSGTRYALIRSASLFSYTGALEELLYGLSQFFILQKLADADISELQEHFSLILKTAIESGAVLHITSDNASLDNALPVLKKFASELNLLPPCKKSIERDIQEKKIYALVKKQISGKFSKKEIFTAPSQVSYTAQVFKIESVSKSEMAARKVLCHYLQSSSLWEKIRVIGGAYGSSASCDYLTNVVSFSSYRDPLPFNSLNTFLSCVKEFSKMTLSDAEVEKAITGTYGTMTRPLSPYSRGYAGFRQKLYGLTDEEKDLRLQEILKVTKTSLKDAAIALIEGFSKKHSTVLCDSSLVKEEKVINLPI